MMGFKHCRRLLLAVGTGLLLAGCQIIPDTGAPSTPPPPTRDSGPVSRDDARTPPPIDRNTPAPLPRDDARHRVALLVPTTGDNARVGQSIANATTMALLDTNASNLRVTTYDTAGGASAAARRAVADGNRLILGPLMGDNVADVIAEVQGAGVPIITFSNDTDAAAQGVYLMGLPPAQSIARTVAYAQRQGARRYAILVPQDEYGRQAELALIEALRESDGSLVATERYSRGEASAASAARRLRTRGGYDTVLLADSPRLAIAAARELRDGNGSGPRILGTERWSGEAAIPAAGSLDGALFSALPDNRYRGFAQSYRDRFGDAPYRIATLGYDSVLLALRVAGNGWQPGTPFPTRQLADSGGFLGLDGAFRFRSDGVADRTLEVREVRDGQVVAVSPAPSGF